MARQEMEPTGREKWGARIRNGGIIAGLIGLVTSMALLTGGAIATVGGEWLRRSGKKQR